MSTDTTSQAGRGAPASLTAPQRRRPPSPVEQANRTNRIKPWAELWKSEKQSGRWG